MSTQWGNWKLDKTNWTLNYLSNGHLTYEIRGKVLSDDRAQDIHDLLAAAIQSPRNHLLKWDWKSDFEPQKIPRKSDYVIYTCLVGVKVPLSMCKYIYIHILTQSTRGVDDRGLPVRLSFSLPLIVHDRPRAPWTKNSYILMELQPSSTKSLPQGRNGY